MRFRRGRQEEVSVNVTPLIDVVFLLLIFFMVTTTFSRETQLQIDLPESQSQVAVEDELPIEILIDRTGTYALNDKVLLKQDIGSLKRALTELSDASKTKPIVITADAQTPHQSFIIALDAVAQLGFTKVSITTQAEANDN
ncbi:biopolymer transporter ExbD [Reinekea sp.]|jgi:biopolymer transport protein ExbD|uniref:ExbD/TolR family protein n=1 Tax=Reinekea sp. TaxID=1970455 RepID=UPI002A8259BF|nr:biopolymer transporter ExbD [Reinekea sp.]